MADFRSTLYSIDEGGGGSISWQPLLEISRTVNSLRCIPGDLLAALSDRLKSEATHVVLNTLTALHTICLNSPAPVHDQLLGSSSKVMKALERLLNKPPFPGVEGAAAQLLMDWAFLYGQEELGRRSFAALTGSRQQRSMLQGMAASDVAVLLREDGQLGLPQYASLIKGLDFQSHFAAQQLGSPMGGTAAPSVSSQLAKAAVETSYSDNAAAAAAAAASRNTFAAWAERVAQDPQAAAQRVLDSQSNIQSDLDALEAAQEACVAAARECAKQQQQQPLNSSSSKAQPASAAGAAGGMVTLRHQLDKTYLAACKANEWREMTEVLVQQRLPDTQLSSLLSLADKINGVLDSWQQAATTEVFWLLGVNTAGLADGSTLNQVVAAATAAAGTGATAAAGTGSTPSTPTTAATAESSFAAAAAAAAASGAGASSREQQQQEGRQLQQRSSLARGSSYLDLLTGDTPAALSTSNPFLIAGSSSTGTVAGSISSSSALGIWGSVGPPAAAIGRAGLPAGGVPSPPPPAGGITGTAAGMTGTAAAAAPDELQRYLQELGVGPGSVPPGAVIGGSQQGSGSTNSFEFFQIQQVQQNIVRIQQHYPAGPGQALGQFPSGSSSSTASSLGPPLQLLQQQQRRVYPTIQHTKPSGSADFGPQVQQQQQTVGWMGQQPPLQRYPNIPPVSQPSLQQQQQQQQQALLALRNVDRSASTGSTGSSITLGGRQGTGSAGSGALIAAAAGPSSTGSAGAAAAAAAATAAGDSGSSSDGGACAAMSYTNPFASLDTNTIMKGLKGPSGGAAAAAAAAGGGGGGGGASGHTSPAATTAAAAAAAAGGGGHGGGSGPASAPAGALAGRDARIPPRSISMDGASSSSSTADGHHNHHAQPKRAAPPPPLQQQQQQQHAAAAAMQQQQPALQLQTVQEQGGEAHGQAASPFARTPPALSPAYHQQQGQGHQQGQGQWDHLRGKVQQLFQSAAALPSHCTTCGLAGRSALEAAVLQLLVEQQLHHELQVQQLQAQHQQQVAEIKAMAVQRFKELQQQLATQQHQHQQ